MGSIWSCCISIIWPCVRVIWICMSDVCNCCFRSGCFCDCICNCGCCLWLRRAWRVGLGWWFWLLYNDNLVFVISVVYFLFVVGFCLDRLSCFVVLLFFFVCCKHTRLFIQIIREEEYIIIVFVLPFSLCGRRLCWWCWWFGIGGYCSYLQRR